MTFIILALVVLTLYGWYDGNKEHMLKKKLFDYLVTLPEFEMGVEYGVNKHNIPKELNSIIDKYLTIDNDFGIISIIYYEDFIVKIVDNYYTNKDPSKYKVLVERDMCYI